MVKSTELDGLIEDRYVPSSVERKKAVLMYFFVGIIAALSRDEVSIYEMFHLKQSMGRRTCFFVFLVLSVVFLFIPYLRVIPLVIFVLFVIVWFIFLKQAREGRYTFQDEKILMPIFAGLGEWMTTIFELEVEEDIDE